MGLINLKTDLRTLKYRGDRLGYTTSNEPYIRNPLTQNYEDTPGDNIFGAGADGIGRQGASVAAAIDASRLSLFFNDGKNPRSGIFPLKQKLLSLQGPQTPYAPIRGTFRSENLILQAELNGTGTHLNSRGAIPFGDNYTGYQYLTKTFFSGDSNRLNILYTKKIANTNLKGGQILAANAFGVNTLFKTSLFTYAGGARSPITNISRDVNTTEYVPGLGKIYEKVFTFGNQEFYYKDRLNSTGFGGNGQVNNFVLDIANNSTPTAKTILGRTTDYSKFNRSTTFGIADSSGTPIDRQAYYEGKPNRKNSKYDKINANLIYESTKAKTAPADGSYEDLIKFYIGVINNDNPTLKTYIHFRAYLNDISDSYSAEWDSFRYMGRGEKFYQYKGFDRSISLGFDVHVGSRVELFPIYQKLNYLASVTAPDYSLAGFMRGNIVELTIGDYLNNVPGIIEGFEYDISQQDSSWDIARTNDGKVDENSAELPTLINVSSFTFKPIHNFVPRLVKTVDNPKARFLTLGDKGYTTLPAEPSQRYSNPRFL